MTFRPSQMRERYRDIVVALDPPNPPVHVSVTKYACQVVGYGTGQRERAAYKDRLYQATRHDRLGMSGHEMVDVLPARELSRILRNAFGWPRGTVSIFTKAPPPEPVQVWTRLRAFAASLINI